MLKSLLALTFIFSLFSFCTMVNHAPKNVQGTDKAFDLQGHRGCRGLLPENTIPAMLKALELGVNTLELDVVITADKQVVLSHEPFFNHQIATKPNGEPVNKSEEKQLNIYKMTYDDVRKFDVGSRPHPNFQEQQKMAVHKPLLADVFDAVNKWCDSSNKPIPFFNIETKTQPASDDLYHPRPDVFCDLLMEVVAKSGLKDQVIIQSFDIRTLQYLHQKHPAMPLALLIEGYNKKGVKAQVEELGFVPEIYSPQSPLVKDSTVDICKEMKMKLIPWTVNDTTEANRLKSLGVDGIITDYPDRIR